MPWQVLLRRALAARDINRFLGANRAHDDADWLDDEEVRRALRTVASFLAKPSLTPWGYDQGAHGLLRRNRRGRRHRATLQLPTSVQIISYCQTWAAALKLAGLQPTRGPGMRPGLPVLDALDLCISAHRTFPS